MSDLPVHVYSPEPLLRHPGLMLRELFRDIMLGRELAWRLFLRDLSAQYRQTYFGYLWAFLPPLVASLTFIFLQSQGIVTVEGVGIPYPAFAMIGTLLWQVFVDAVMSPSQAVTNAKPMLAKINFPREAILLAGLYMVSFNFLIRLILVFGVMVVWQIPVGFGVIVFPFAMLGLLLCGFAVGLAIVPVGSLYGDVSRAIPMIAQFWMLLTPVVYPPRDHGVLGWLSTWNPIAPLLITARESLTGQVMSSLPAFAIVTAASLAIASCGLVAFRVAMPHLVARMGG